MTSWCQQRKLMTYKRTYLSCNSDRPTKKVDTATAVNLFSERIQFIVCVNFFQAFFKNALNTL